MSAATVACRRRLDPPSWSMLHLARLSELTFSGDGAGDAMWELLGATDHIAPTGPQRTAVRRGAVSGSAQLLPPGLRVLRQDGGEFEASLNELR